MRQVISHDVDGRPIYIGDSARVINSFHKEHSGIEVVVIGIASDDRIGDILVDLVDDMTGQNFSTFGFCLRKNNDGMEPGEYSFEDLMESLRVVEVIK